MTEVRREVADDTRRHLTHIARGGALGLFGAGISAIAGFVLVLIVTNLYPAHTAGLFFTVTSAFLLMAAIATLGTETGLGRFLLRYEAQGRRGDIPPTLRAAFRPTILYSVVIAIVVIVFAEPLADLIGLEGEEGATSLRVLAAVLPLCTWNTLTLAGTRAFGRMRPTVMVDKIARPVAQPVLVFLVSIGGRGRLVGLTLAWAIPYAVAPLVVVVAVPALPAAARHHGAHRADQELPGAPARVLGVHLAPEHHPHLPDGHPAHGHHPDRGACAPRRRRRSTPPRRASWRWASSAPRRSSRCSSRSSPPCSRTTSARASRTSTGSRRRGACSWPGPCTSGSLRRPWSTWASSARSTSTTASRWCC